MNNKGSITIYVRDAETMQIKQTLTATNVISYNTLINDLYGPNTDTVWVSTANDTGAVPRFVAVSDRVIAQNNRAIGQGIAGHTDYPTSGQYPANANIFIQDIMNHSWEYTEATPPYIELSGRFNSPSSVRTINSVFLTSHQLASEYTATAIGLATPCIQNPGEVLDITYRIQFFGEVSVPTSDVFISPDFMRNGYIGTRWKSTNGASSFPEYNYPYFTKTPDATVDNEIVRFDVQESYSDTDLEMSAAGGNRERRQMTDHFKVEFTNELEKSDLVGQVIRSVGYTAYNSGNFESSTPIDGGQYISSFDVYQSTELMSPMFKEDFPHKPIQPIQNHNANAIEWGLDVDYLASSQGSIAVNGDNWTNPDWPEFWRIEFSKTGEVGTANYFFRNRRILGFRGIDYTPTYLTKSWDQISNAYPTRKTVTRDHGLSENLKTEEYGADSYISWDDDGINIHIINDSRVMAFDSTTTPALPATRIAQVAVSASGSIWVACRNTGLYRITNPLDKTSAVVSKMDDASNTLLSSGSTTCYAVAVGYNNSMFAVFDGSLSKTSNPDDATPLFENYTPTSPVAFSYVGLTDSNWSLTKYLKVDPESPDDELAVMYRSGDSEQIVWWSANGVAIEGPLSGTQVNASNPQYDGTQINSVDVSKHGSLWLWFGPSATSAFIQKLTWGLTTYSQVTNLSSYGFTRPTFLYDYYNTPYCGNIASSQPFSSTSSRRGPTLISVDGEQFSFGTGTLFDSSQGPVSGFAWSNKRASGIYNIFPNTYTSSGYRSGTARGYLQHAHPSNNDSILDSLNGQHSPYEELCWDKFHWNGSSWQRDYYAPAIDTNGGTSYNATRHNFDTESHKFTGRSMIDASDSFALNNFSSQLTFVASIRPEQKEDSSTAPNGYSKFRTKRQEFPITLFDFSTKSRQCKLMLQTNDSSAPKISFYDNGVESVISNSVLPIISSGFYRIAVSIDGTSLSVYVDGVQVGSTITLSSAYDFSNTSSEMLAFIGCRAYKWDEVQRNKPYQSEFFKGTMENIQIWNVSWNSTDVSNDYSDITSVITSKPVANLISRFELTDSLEGLETKATHSSPELMDEGITIAFTNGAQPDSFVATDYYTFGVVDGILKDNATSLTRKSSVYFKPVDYNFSEFINDSGTSVVEGSSSTQVTELACFKSSEVPATDTITLITAYQTPDVFPGYIFKSKSGSITDNAWFYVYTAGGFTHQRIDNDGYFECQPAAADTKLLMGLATSTVHEISSSSVGSNATYVEYGVELHPNGELNIREAGTIVSSVAGNYTLDTIIRIKRIGTVITYNVVNAGVETTIYTSSTASTGSLYGVIVMNDNGNGAVNVKINYTRLDNMLTVGNPLTMTGKYNPDYIRIDAIDPSSYAIELDSIPATVTMVDSETLEFMPSPAPLEVVIDSRTGWLIFNDADIGKTVTGRVTVIYDAQ